MQRKKRDDRAPKKRKLIVTHKQKLFLQHFMKSHSREQAALAAGYCTKYAANCGSRVLLNLAKKVPSLLNDMGLTVENVVENCVIPALLAKEVKTESKDGYFTDAVAFVDHRTRLAAADMVMKLHGAYAPKEQLIQQASTVRTLVLDVPTVFARRAREQAQQQQQLPGSNGSNGKEKP